MKKFLALFLLFLAGCTQGSKIQDGFLGGVALSLSQSSIDVSANAVTLGNTLSVRLTTRDQNGNKFYNVAAPATVVFSLSGGTSEGHFGPVADSGNGVYTAVFTSTAAGSATHILATVNGETLTGTTPAVTVVASSSSFTMDLPFDTGTEASYTSDGTHPISSAVEFTSGGVCRLKPASQSDNSASAFSSMVLNGLQYDSSNQILRLNTNVNNSSLDASWTPQWSSLVAYWKLDGSGSIANGDTLSASVGGSSLNGSANGNLLSYTTGKVGTALSLPGSDYIDVPDSTVLDGTSQLSVSFWVKPTNLDGNPRGVLCKRITSDHDESYCFFFYTNNNLYVDINGTSTRFGTNAVFSNGKWYRVVIVFDGTLSSTARTTVYINGLQDKVASGPSYINNFSSGLVLGGMQANSSMAGSLDDVAIWKKPLTYNEVQLLYQRQSPNYSGTGVSRVISAFGSSVNWTSISSTTTLPFLKELTTAASSETTASYSSIPAVSTSSPGLSSGLIGLWHLNGARGLLAAGSTLADSSGLGHDAVIADDNASGTPFRTYGKIERAISLSESDDAINIGAADGDINSAKGSLSFWVRRNFYDGDGSDHYFFRIAKDTGNRIMMYYRNANGDIRLLHQGNGHSTSLYFSPSLLPWNEWAFVTVTWSVSSDSMSLYVNGTPAAGSVSGIGDWGSAPTTAFIGNGNNVAKSTFDEVALWNRDLSSAEALQLYRRYANRIKYQIRTCANSDCSDQEALTSSGKGWKGPTNDASSYFSELDNNSSINSSAEPTGTVSASLMSLAFSAFGSAGLSVGNSVYIQYRVLMESEDANTLCSYDSGSTHVACSPELKSVSLGPDHYSTTVQTVISAPALGTSYIGLDNETAAAFENPGPNACSAGLRYALSPDEALFYYWNGSAWALSSDYSTANDAGTLSAHLGTFPAATSGKRLTVKTFLKSDGSSPCELTQLHLSGIR